MPNERENLYQPLEFADYNIGGNTFRAYYDADKKLVVIIDETESESKPNVLLVINPVGNRKWDDILMNDYGVDLETIRPKRDNKYQKLDIEYTGLMAYDNLIRAYENDDNLSAPLAELTAFRNAAARRAALERLGAAEMTATRARETIERTNETTAELQAKLKALRSKLTTQRREIGREPTKQSAAKILRTESQIDATSDKLDRAKKRLTSAQHRLAMAQDDAEIAQHILDILNDDDALLPTTPTPSDVAIITDAPVPMTQNNEPTEPKATQMADDEVKPLFDKDPEFLDEEIAFKPIDFDAPISPAPITPSADSYVEPTPIQPLSFAPPSAVAPVETPEPIMPTPVLDSITSVNAQPDEIAPELLPTIDTPDMLIQSPIPQPDPTPSEMPMAPVLPSDNITPAPQPTTPDIAPAPISSDFRPVSPISGAPAVVATAPTQRKPTLMYYILLIVLIVLSIFTLWIYQQKSTNGGTPELGAKSQPAEPTITAPAETPEPVTDEPSPFIETVTAVVEPEPTVVEPEPIVAEPEPVAPVVVADIAQVDETITPTIVPVTAEPATEPVLPAATITSIVGSPFLTEDGTEPTKQIPTEAEILASKPSYNVSQQEKMFVADAEYETDIEPEPEIITEEVVEETCADGNAPDADGCCAGEYLTDLGGGEYACCVDGTDECFPPMF